MRRYDADTHAITCWEGYFVSVLSGNRPLSGADYGIFRKMFNIHALSGGFTVGVPEPGPALPVAQLEGRDVAAVEGGAQFVGEDRRMLDAWRRDQIETGHGFT